MPSSFRLFVLVAAVACVTACSSAPPVPRKTPKPTAVRVAFEKNFMQACLTGVRGPAASAYCLCTRDAIDDAYADKELPKVVPSDPRVRMATHDCAAKFGLPIRPGH